MADDHDTNLRTDDKPLAQVRQAQRLTRFHICSVLVFLVVVLAFGIYASQTFVRPDRAHTYSGGIFLCLGLIGSFSVLWYRTENVPPNEDAASTRR